MTAPTLTCLCGATYTDNADGRLRHKVLHGHAPAVGRRTREDVESDGRTS